MSDPDPSAGQPKELVKRGERRPARLTGHERKVLAAAEATIEENLGAWVNVSNAFLEIADGRLYREEFPTFEAYVAERWGLSRSQGHRIALSGRVRMSPVGDRIRNERQARELASLLDDPELLVRVVDRAEELTDGRLTARALRQARTELALPPAEAAKARKVYEAAEWTRELEEKWQEGIIRSVEQFTDELPPELWVWAFAEVQTRKPRNKRDPLSGLVKIVAYDAPLTPEVVAFLREASRRTETRLVEVFSGEIEALGTGQEGIELTEQVEPMFKDEYREEFNAHLGDVRAAFVASLEAIAARMAEVVTATAEAPALRTWTPEQVEQARSEWTALCDSAERGKVRPGPLLDLTRGGLAKWASDMVAINEAAVTKAKAWRKAIENGTDEEEE